MSGIIDFGITKEHFLRDFADRRMHLVRGAVSAHLVDWARLNEMLYYIDPMPPHVRVHRGGVVPESQYVEDVSVAGVPGRRMNPVALQRLLAEGATVVLNRVDARFELVRRLCAEVSAFSNAECLANGYLAFSGQGSFGNHWDTHDVMAIQLIGRKRWRVYAPTFPLPLSGQTSKEWKDRCPPEPVFDGILEPGDLLYLPRGWWHNASPIGETFHVAIGMHTASVVHFVSWLCQTALREHEWMRRTLRPGCDTAPAVADAVAVVSALMQDPARLSEYMAVLQHSLISTHQSFELEKLSVPASRPAELSQTETA